MVNLTKSAVLAESKSVMTDPKLSGWTYLSSKHQYVKTPVAGVTIVLALSWSFRKWEARSNPNFSIHSQSINEIRKNLLGETTKSPALRRHYQKIWRAEGTPRSHTAFVEDMPDSHKYEYNISMVPKYIIELMSACENSALHAFDFGSERTFLESMPETFHYNGDPVVDPISFVLKETLLGKLEAADVFTKNPNVPPAVLERINGDLELIQKNSATISPSSCFYGDN